MGGVGLGYLDTVYLAGPLVARGKAGGFAPSECFVGNHAEHGVAGVAIVNDNQPHVPSRGLRLADGLPGHVMSEHPRLVCLEGMVGIGDQDKQEPQGQGGFQFSG